MGNRRPQFTELPRAFRLCERVFKRPAFCQSGPNHLIADIESFTKLSKRCSNSKSSFDSVRTCISCLCDLICPSTISRLVISFVVDPVYLAFRRLLSHVRQKVFKTIPSFADSDSSTSISVKCFVLRISTSVLHYRPTSPCWRYLGLLRMTVDKVCSVSRFFVKTTAGFGVSTGYFPLVDLNLVSAVTAAEHIRIGISRWFSSCWSLSNNCKKSEFLSKDIDLDRHSRIVTYLSGGVYA